MNPIINAQSFYWIVSSTSDLPTTSHATTGFFDQSSTTLQHTSAKDLPNNPHNSLLQQLTEASNDHRHRQLTTQNPQVSELDITVSQLVSILHQPLIIFDDPLLWKTSSNTQGGHSCYLRQPFTLYESPTVFATHPKQIAWHQSNKQPLDSDWNC